MAEGSRIQTVNRDISMHKSANNYFIFAQYSAWFCGSYTISPSFLCIYLPVF